MVTVLLTACINASCIQVWKWHLRVRYDSAHHDHLKFRKYYEEGRVTPLKYFEKSETLMAAELALAGENDHRDIVSQHVARITQVMRQEENDLTVTLSCGGIDFLAEAREYVDGFMAKTRAQR
jgi:hypothetical protein